MNSITINQANQRLDQVVFEYYGDLSLFDAVMTANPHITNPMLEKGTQLVMPEQTVIEEEDKLW